MQDDHNFFRSVIHRFLSVRYFTDLLVVSLLESHVTQVFGNLSTFRNQNTRKTMPAAAGCKEHIEDAVEK